MTRRLLATLGLATLGLAALGLGLAGCGGPGAPPTTPVWTPTTGPVEPASPPPTSPSSTSPSPQWEADQQAAVDAVTVYLAQWSRIGQNLDTADWNDIRDVAVDPAAQNDLLMWYDWQDQGWHLVGEQTFSAQSVSFDHHDDAGSWYFVDGCLSIAGSDILDAQGQSAGGPDRQDTSSIRFTTLETTNGAAFVAGSDKGQTEC